MIPQSRPDLRRRDFDYLWRILRTSQVAGGPLVARLEERFCESVGVRHAAATSSGTAALHLGLLALGVGLGDDVLVPSYTCASVAQAIRHTGAQVRLVDVEVDTLNPSAAMVRRRLTRRTRALVLTHTLGFPAPLDELLTCDVPIIEDCAVALGARYDGRPVGRRGVFSAFSLYATKPICAGEGGMVCSDDRRLIERVRDLNGPDKRKNWRPRFNYKLSDLAAGLALAQLHRLSGLLSRRHALAARYRAAFRACPVELPCLVPGGQPNYYRFLVRTSGAARVIDAARRTGIWCDRPVFEPLHRYLGGGAFPGAETLSTSIVSVPLYPSLTPLEVRKILTRMPAILDGAA